MRFYLSREEATGIFVAILGFVLLISGMKMRLLLLATVGTFLELGAGILYYHGMSKKKNVYL